MDLKGLRTIAVGGASGMAKATAERIVAGGGTVAILDRPTSDGAGVASALGGSFFACDAQRGRLHHLDVEVGTRRRRLAEVAHRESGAGADRRCEGGAVAARTVDAVARAR